LHLQKLNRRAGVSSQYCIPSQQDKRGGLPFKKEGFSLSNVLSMAQGHFPKFAYLLKKLNFTLFGAPNIA
jgi:hypothetical protein